jgi:hypothetical protein
MRKLSIYISRCRGRLGIPEPRTRRFGYTGTVTRLQARRRRACDGEEGRRRRVTVVTDESAPGSFPANA